MRNITVSVDEETHRLARVRAAELDTSLSALVRGYLQSLAKDGTRVGDESVGERRARLLREVVAGFDARGVGLDPRENLTREELYDEAIDGRDALR